MVDPTPHWGIHRWDDTAPAAPLEDFFNTQADDLEAALDGAATGWFLEYDTRAAMNAVPGTRVNQHAMVNADSIPANNGDYVWSGSAWVAAVPVQQKLVSTVTVGGLLVQTGTDALQGSGGVSLSAPITFPTAYSVIPGVAANVIGYKAHSGTFAISGLSNGSEYAQAQKPTKTGFSMYLTPPSGTLSTSFDWYVSWIAVGLA